MDLDRERVDDLWEWPFLETEPDLAEEDREAAAQLEDFSSAETSSAAARHRPADEAVSTFAQRRSAAVRRAASVQRRA